MINVLSLFDGISCGQVALSRARIPYDLYFASEIDEYAIKVAQYNFPDTIQLGNVINVKSTDLPNIDLLIGGSPCQGFSYAGNQLNFDDPRSMLFFEFVRLKDEIQPQYFLLENVPMKKQYQDTITYYLGVKPITINSTLVSAQNRIRLYWTNIPNITQPINKNIIIQNIIEYDVPAKYYLSSKAKSKIDRYSLGYIPTGKSPTLTTELAHSTGSYITPKLIKEIGQNRRATPIECERLQTLPDDYTSMVADTHRYRLLGNCWTVDIIVHIFGGII